MTLVIRFVTALQKVGNHQARVDIREHFLEFLSLENTTGMADILSTALDKHDLFSSNIRGQRCDNGANMSGKKLIEVALKLIN